MFNNLSLQARMFGSYLFIGLLVLIVALVGWIGTSRLSGHINTFNNNALPSAVGLWKINEGKTQIQSSERRLFDPEITELERESALANIQKAWVQINDGFQQYETTPTNNQAEEKQYQKFKEAWEAWKQAHQNFLEIEEEYNQLGIRNLWERRAQLLSEGKKENSPEMAEIKAARELYKRLDTAASKKEEPLFKRTEDEIAALLKLNDELAAATQTRVEQDVTQTTFWVILGLAIGPLTAVLFGFYFSKPLSSKIVEVVRVAERISSGDLTTQVQITGSRDEIGKLLDAFRIMIQTLNSLISQVQQSGIQVTTSATQIAASGKELEATVQEQLASTNEVVATAKEIAATSGQLVQTMEEVAAMAQSTTTAAGSGQKDLVRMETTMNQLADATGSISSKLGVISEKANNINSVVITITKVADQTNLLSLNAAIEAEKAGEYGLGFAVVAREIRRLADRTAIATLDIESMVKEMQSAVSIGVMEMDKFTKEVARSVEDIRNISVQIAQIIEQVQALSPRFEAVNQGMESQAMGASQISEAMVQLSEASSQTAQSLREINGAIAQLNEAAVGLRQEISRFQVNS